MRTLIYVLILCFICTGCRPIQEKILGTYDIDTDRGCSNCGERGPQLMVFEEWEIDDGNLGQYSFEYQNGATHSGTYDFLQLDTLIKLILYPDSATFEYYGILGSAQQTEYRVVGNKIKEKCEGVFRNCIWVRRD